MTPVGADRITGWALRSVACGCLALIPSGALAQVNLEALTVNASAADTWAEFETACGAVVTDTNGFVQAHPQTDASGQTLVAQSTDGQVLMLYHFSDKGVYRQVEITGVPGELRALCHVTANHWMTDMTQAEARATQMDRDLRALMEGRPELTLVGGQVPQYTPIFGMVPESESGVFDSYVYGIKGPLWGEERYVYARIDGGMLNFTGMYVVARAEATAARDPEPANVKRPAVPSEAMRAVVDICLRNYRTPHKSLPALEAAGMTLSPTGDGASWEMQGDGVFGYVQPGDELYCSVQSTAVPLDIAKQIGSDLAFSLFPDMVQQGAPEGETGPCDGLSIFAPRQMIWLRYAQAGNSGECIEDGTSAIIVN